MITNTFLTLINRLFIFLAGLLPASNSDITDAISSGVVSFQGFIDSVGWILPSNFIPLLLLVISLYLVKFTFKSLLWVFSILSLGLIKR